MLVIRKIEKYVPNDITEKKIFLTEKYIPSGASDKLDNLDKCNIDNAYKNKPIIGHTNSFGNDYTTEFPIKWDDKCTSKFLLQHNYKCNKKWKHKKKQASHIKVPDEPSLTHSLFESVR